MSNEILLCYVAMGIWVALFHSQRCMEKSTRYLEICFWSAAAGLLWPLLASIIIAQCAAEPFRLKHGSEDIGTEPQSENRKASSAYIRELENTAARVPGLEMEIWNRQRELDHVDRQLAGWPGLDPYRTRSFKIDALLRMTTPPATPAAADAPRVNTIVRHRCAIGQHGTGYRCHSEAGHRDEHDFRPEVSVINPYSDLPARD